MHGKRVALNDPDDGPEAIHLVPMVNNIVSRAARCRHRAASTKCGRPLSKRLVALWGGCVYQPGTAK